MRQDRIASIDTLRGLCLLIMALDHFGGLIRNVTWQTFGFVSVAEGFFFISSFLYGYVYGADWYTSRTVKVLSLRRAKSLFVYQAVLLLLVLILILIGDRFSVETWSRYHNYFRIDPYYNVILAFLHLYFPYHYCDILPLFFYFLLLAPVVLRFFQDGKAKRVFTASMALWLLSQPLFSQFFPVAVNDILFRYQGSFNILSWQFLYVVGIWIGFSVRHGKMALYENKKILMACVFLVAVGLLLRRRVIFSNIEWVEPWVERRVLAVGRLLNFFVLAYILAWMIRWRGGWHHKWLSFLGRHSLQVFIYHAVVLIVFSPLRWRWVLPNGWLELGVSLLFGASLTLPAWGHTQFLRWRIKSSSSV